ncbi:hypothetical protein WMY93_019272 [Mugilogobius chulae]|uniref:C-type lectin domain-containing protein n=1 Tax=Mugilogobius chulae TaxID=88201 RepID=A0AAW0NJA3_9GOBI
MTWIDAQTHCRKEYDDLASLTSQTELMDVRSLLEPMGVQWAWIGLYKPLWTTWSDSSTNTNFYNWETPFNIYTDDYCGCVTAATGKWKVMPCTSFVKFICFGDTQKQTVVKMKFQSKLDLNNMELQRQIIEQMENRLRPAREANLTVKWRVTAKTSNLTDPVTNQNVQIKCHP